MVARLRSLAHWKLRKELLPVRLSLIGLFLLLLAPSSPSQGQGGCTVPDDCLPPPNARYVGNFHAFFQIPGSGVLDFSNLMLDRFSNCNPLPHRVGDPITHTFEAVVQGELSIQGGMPIHFEAPARGTMRITLAGHHGQDRTFDTEMLQLDLSGGTLPKTLLIRESPTLSSLGYTLVTRIPRGNFRVGSFFDIFTELSLDGGQTWIPAMDANGQRFAGRMRLAMCEPQ